MRGADGKIRLGAALILITALYFVIIITYNWITFKHGIETPPKISLDAIKQSALKGKK